MIVKVDLKDIHELLNAVQDAISDIQMQLDALNTATEDFESLSLDDYEE